MNTSQQPVRDVEASAQGRSLYYDEGGVTLYCGDALQVLESLTPGRFNAFIADPPYSQAGGSSNGRGSQYEDQFFSYWLAAIGQSLRRAVNETGAGFVFCDWRTVGNVRNALTDPKTHLSGKVWTVPQALVWDRELIGMGSPFRNGYEMIAFVRGPQWANPGLSKDISTVRRHKWYYGNREYPAEKPVALIKELIEFTGTTGPVLDPFGGSAPTALACRELGLECVLIERSEAACEVAAKRLSQGNIFTPA